MENYDHLIKYNDDGHSVSVPFGRAAEYYISKHPLLKNIRLKARSRLRAPQLVNNGIITLKRVEGAVDYVEWTTSSGKTKSTNRIDDIIELTEKGEKLVEKIQEGKQKDKLCWSWVMYCAGDGNTCQHLCGGIGTCNPDCPNANLPNNLKNSNDIHRCRLRVVTESRLSWIKTPHQLKIKIEGWHLPPNVLVTHEPQVTRVNLTRSARDKIIISRRADRWTADVVKNKILVSKQGATEDDLHQEVVKNRDICNSKQLKRLIIRDDRRVKDNSGPWTVLQNYIQDVLKPRGHVLYYHTPDLSAPDDSPERYYQLIVSDDLWLMNGRNYGHYCFCIDGNNELNMDRATVLTMVVETDLALSNGDDKTPVRCAITAIRKNLPCSLEDCEHPWHYEDLPNERGFKRIRKCSQDQPWNPIAMIDQHLPIKKVLDGVVAGTCLSWTFLMQKLAENLKNWDVSRSLRYPIALGYKIIGRSRTEEESADMARLFKVFIDSIPLTCVQKNSIKEDLDINWMNDEWRCMIVDRCREYPDQNSDQLRKPMTTNSLTERITKRVIVQLDGKLTPLAFLERLFGVKLRRDVLHADNFPSEDNQDNAGLITFFNSQSFDHHKDYYYKTQLSADMVRSLNLGRFYFLSELVEPTDEPHCYYVKRHDEPYLTLTSSYDGKLISLDGNAMEKLNIMMNRFIERHEIVAKEGYYMANIKTGECLLCYDFIWNGRFRDTCKHVHAAKLYAEAQRIGDFASIINETKIKLIEYFNCREINETQQNTCIRRGTVDAAFAEIQRLYVISGDKIFDSTMLYNDTCIDPFRNFKQKRRIASKQSIPVTSKKARISEYKQGVAINEHIEGLQATSSYDLQRNELTTDIGSSFIDPSISRVGREESGVPINEFTYSSFERPSSKRA
ncbi:1074_t:CDS:2 [Funneliformis geosporum]|uniref:1074_t:CDS:1 n=1 Tax=Funneliformis geosporum TaxID=1117311 RepID=A0A9W4SUS3_9GLOM|nr:1074_t:CDS:2 [Funneliformis geosporum]